MTELYIYTVGSIGGENHRTCPVVISLGNNMITFTEYVENNFITINFINQSGDKIGQLSYEISNNKAVIHNTYIFPDYRRTGILKTHLPIIFSKLKQYNITHIELSTLSEDAKKVWEKFGFIEYEINKLRLLL